MIQIVPRPPAVGRAARHDIVIERGLRTSTRDGVELATDVLRPNDDRPRPVILVRTPYNKVASHESARYRYLAERGYVVALQDCRGRFNSGGDFFPYVHEMEDGHDAVEWVAAQDWCDGNVGMTGGSYVGQTCWFAAAAAPPALKAIAPITSPPGHAWLNEPLWGGCFLFAMADWMVWMGRRSFASATDALTQWQEVFEALPLADVPTRGRTTSEWWAEWMEHPVYDDLWRRSGYEHRWPEITVPALNITGWWDMNFPGAPRNFAGMRRHGATEESRQQRLVIGPWAHLVNTARELDGWDFGVDAVIDLNALLLDFFDRWLGDGMHEPERRIGVANTQAGMPRDTLSGAAGDEPPVHVFVVGANEWWSLDDWPPSASTPERWHLRCDGYANSVKGDGRLARAAPGDEPPDRYTYDPLDPVRQTWTVTDGPVDDRLPTIRDDVLVYTSGLLAEPLTAAGRPWFEFWASSSARDTDWHARLVDVHPDDSARFLAHGALRARFRNSFEEPELLEPGDVVAYRIELGDIGVRFGVGHRIRLELSSSWLGRFDRNTNTGAPNIFTDRETVVAEQTVFHDRSRPSAIILPVLR